MAWGDPKRRDSQTRRYRLAEALSPRTNHMLLLTATPHMGKSFPYFALWRLLDPNVFTTPDALPSLEAEKQVEIFFAAFKRGDGGL